MPLDVLTPATHVQRADRHFVVGETLEQAGDEWAAVCYFYSAYHLLKAALQVDPVFDDLPRLASINRNLTIDDRHCSRHQGSRGLQSPVLGLNEVVGLLYPGISTEYRLLHAASVQVRYKAHLNTRVVDCRSYLGVIRKQFDEGQLAYSG